MRRTITSGALVMAFLLLLPLSSLAQKRPTKKELDVKMSPVERINNNSPATIHQQHPALILPVQRQKNGIITPRSPQPAKAEVAKSEKMKTNNYRKIATMQDGSQLWGQVITSNDWTVIDAHYGIYSFDVKDLNRTPLFTTWNSMYSTLNANGGSIFYDNIYHFISYYSAWSYTSIYYNEINTSTWSVNGSQDRDAGTDLSIVAISEAYDPTTGTIYAYTPNADGTAGQISTIDYTTLKSTAIAASDTAYLAMACSKQGELYAISDGGNLYKMDKTTGAATLIGKTGVTPAVNLQSATFNTATGKLYWAALTGTEGAYSSALYEVDTTTGAAEKVKDFNNAEEIVGLAIIPAPDPSSPSAAQNLSADYKDGSATGTISFTVPTTTYNNSELTGTVDYVVKANGKMISTGSAQPGEKVALDNITLPLGQVSISVVLSNAAGDSENASLSLWIGIDNKPKKVDNLQYKIVDGNKVVLTWDAVKVGVHDAYLNPDSVRYQVVRYPGYQMLADSLTTNTYTDEVSLDTFKLYRYIILPIFKDNYGDESEIKFYLGNSFKVPYKETFDDDGNSTGTNYDGFDTYTVIDGNHDGSTFVVENSYWSGGEVFYKPNKYNDADDWLISPPIALEPGKIYNLQFDGGSEYKYKDILTVKLGKDTIPSHFNKTIMPTTLMDNNFNGMDRRRFTVDEAGDYRIGFHETSTAGLLHGSHYNTIHVVAESVPTAPDSVRNYVAEPGEKGQMYATLSFTSPTKSNNGEDLSKIDSIQIWRNDSVIKTYLNPSVGKDYSYRDDNAKLEGYNKYSVVAFNENGSGLVNEKNIYIGFGMPKAPTNVQLTDNLDDSTALMAWDAPSTVGEFGGWVDPETLTYDTYRRDVTEDPLDGSILINDVMLNSRIKERQVDVKLPVYNDDYQHIFSNFFVKAISQDLPYDVSESAFNSYFIIGKSYPLPFHESFNPNGLDNALWVSEGNTDYTWYIANGLSWDGDNGCCALSVPDAGDNSFITTGKIDISTAAHPMLIFHYYALPGADIQFNAYVDKNSIKQNKNNAEWSLNYKEDTNKEGWVPVAIDLSKYKDAKYINARFAGKIFDTDWPILFDDLNVRDVVSNDMKAVSVVAPSHITAGTNSEVKVRVENYGENTVDNYIVNLYSQGKKVASDTINETLKANYVKDIIMSLPSKVSDKLLKVYAEVVYNADMVSTNNTTDTLAINLNTPDYLTVNDLTAEVEGSKVVLNWSAPDNSSKKTITDSFENYDKYITDGIGNWKTVDVDGAPTYGFPSSVGSFPHMNEPFAYITFNSGDFGLDSVKYANYYAHSGTQFLACFDASTDGKQDDDWLISPVLSGNAQTIKFFAKSWTSEEGDEQFEVLSSTTNDNPNSFKKIGETISTPDSAWTEYSYDLPEGTRYFAIRCVSLNKFIFMVDDITYEPGTFEINGYNIYCNGELIGNVNGSTTTYNDKKVVDGNNDYNVTVMYDVGESAMSNTASIVYDGINELRNVVTAVSGGNKIIRIKNAEGKYIKILTEDGKNIYEGAGRSQLDIPVQRGVYIVRVDEKAIKVLVS